MNRSHSRFSYPFDKRVPLMEARKKHYNVYINYNGETEVYEYYSGYSSIGRQMEKNMHKKKQRQFDKKLCGEY